MILRARVLVTMDGPPIENGAVAILEDRIVNVGKFPEIANSHSGEDIVNLGDQVVLPGLINSHCHLDYTCLRGAIPRQNSFADWIGVINAAKARLTADDYCESINEGFLEAQRFGTTTIANLTAFPELISRIAPPIRTWWFAELIDVRDPERAREMAVRAADQLKRQERWGLAPHAPFTASPNLYRCCEQVAETENILLTTHLGESREEMQMFQYANGALYNFLKEIGRDMSDCGTKTPVEHFFAGLVDANRPYLFVHLNEVSEGDLGLLQQFARSSSIVHCPRSHEYFQHSAFRFETLRNAGFNICLGTDSLASNDDLSLFAEMRAFQENFPSVPPVEILKMATTNPARALQQERALGKIGPGFVADLIAFPIEKPRSIFEEIVAFDRPVRWAMLGGRILGEPAKFSKPLSFSQN